MKIKQKQLKIREKNQFDALEAVKDNKPDDNEKLSKYKQIFEEHSYRRISEIQNMSDQIEFNNLIYYFTTPGLAPLNFLTFRGPIHFYNDIKKW